MAKFCDILIKSERRMCTVDGEPGYFHCWEHYSQPMGAGLTIGSPPAGVYSRVYGIVEFADGVRRVDAQNIKFCDEENAYLAAMKKHKEVKENG